MSKQNDNRARQVTVSYQKSFAAVGIVSGFILFFGTPWLLFMFQDIINENSIGRSWLQSLPGWMTPTVMCVGMGGGVLTIVVSVVFGLLIPSKVTRDCSGTEREEPG